MYNSKQTAVVVGSGFGGLASCFELLAKGYQVKVLEAGDQPGGRARVFKKNGYTFDAGPTVITAPHLFDELFSLVGENTSDWLELLPIDPFYRILFHDGTQFDYVGDEERLMENIRSISPKDVDGYKKLARHSKEIFDVGYTKLADQPFSTWQSMAKAIPDMIRLQNYKSVYSLVSKYIQDDRLRQAFSFEPLLVGGNPFKITSIYLLIHWLERKWGVHFVKGGTTALVKALVDALESKGVEFHYNCEVDSLNIDKGKVNKVRCKGGVSFNCDVLVSNTDPVKVYDQWIDEKWLSKNTSKKVLQKTQSMSLFVSYFGSNKKYDNIVHHTILLGPRYKGLLEDIFKKKNLADDFSLYLHAPTVTDTSLAPVGKEAFYVLSPVPNNQSGLKWDEVKDFYQERIFESLEKRLLPDLRKNLDLSFNITPDYFEKNLNSTHGSAFGIEPSLQQSAYFRFHNQSEDIKGLYFVGANTHPGAGVPGVINSAKVLRRVLPEAQS